MKRHFISLTLLGLVAVSEASPSFGYSYSDTRTLLTNDPDRYGDSPTALWGGTLKTAAGDSPLYLNDLVTLNGPGWDPSIASSFEGPQMDYLDLSSGTPVPGEYTRGDVIPAGANWSFREIASFDEAWNSGTPALGTYDFTVQLIGGDSPSATDVLASFDLHLEVVERLDLDLAATSTPIQGPGSVGRVSVTVRNGMGRDFVVTNPFIDYSSFDPCVEGTTLAGWDGAVFGPNGSTTMAHSDWTAKSGTANGTYYGALGVQGGLHYGDSYYLFANPQTGLVVQGVPEPTTMIGLALGLGAFARRRRKA